LEARMLLSRSSRDTRSLQPGPLFSYRAWGRNKKGLPGDRPRRPGTRMSADSSRALRPPCRYRPWRHGDRSPAVQWIPPRARRVVALWPYKTAAPSTRTASWRTESTL